MTLFQPNATSVELFSGAGGLALGCQLAGFRSLATLELDRWACDTMRENKAAGHELVKDWEIYEGDVRAFDWSQLKEEVTLVSGGPPCQPFSTGGRSAGAADARDMFPSTADILSQLWPKAFIFENVRGLTRTAFAEYFEYIQLRLSFPTETPRRGESWHNHLVRLRSTPASGLHYHVTQTLVNAADYGIPQHRHRVFIVGFRSDLNANWSFPNPTHSKAELLRAQWLNTEYWDEHAVASRNRPAPPTRSTLARVAASGPEGQRWRTLRDALRGLPAPTPDGQGNFPNHHLKLGARAYKGHSGSALDMPSKTLKAGAHGVPGGENMVRFNDGTVRYLTVRESARVQTFPDDYRLHGAWGEAMRQLGNAVPVQLARVVASSVLQTLASNTLKGSSCLSNQQLST